MRDVPKDLSEENVAAWMRETCCLNVQRIPAAELREWERSSGKEGWRIVAYHVLALVREKVREAVTLTRVQERAGGWADDDEVIALVMRDKEAPRA